MKLVQQQFLTLLRAGLWDTPVDATLFSRPTDWMEVFELATYQKVKGIVAEAINKLPTEFQPPIQLLRELAFYLSRNRVLHANHNAILAEIIDEFNHHKILPILLKGQGVATNYPDATLRHCGDIDLYIGIENYAKSRSLFQEWKDKNSPSLSIAKHCSFNYKGITVELHRIAELLYIPQRNWYLQQWTQKHLHQSKLRWIEIDKTKIALPPYQFDAIFILEHAWHHFVFLGGISLRQICDWAEYLNKFSHQIDTIELANDLKRLGLRKAWQLFGYIAVNYLGLLQTKLAFYDDKVKIEADHILQQILIEGCGNENVNQETPGYINRKIKAWHDVFGRRKIIFRYEGMANTILHFGCFVVYGTYRLLKYWRKEE